MSIRNKQLLHINDCLTCVETLQKLSDVHFTIFLNMRQKIQQSGIFDAYVINYNRIKVLKYY